MSTSDAVMYDPEPSWPGLTRMVTVAGSRQCSMLALSLTSMQRSTRLCVSLSHPTRTTHYCCRAGQRQRVSRARQSGNGCATITKGICRGRAADGMRAGGRNRNPEPYSDFRRQMKDGGRILIHSYDWLMNIACTNRSGQLSLALRA